MDPTDSAAVSTRRRVDASAPRRRTFGADEAGRGPILGPMVIAVVGVARGEAAALARRGISDSKTFGAGATARARRAELAGLVQDRASLWRVRVVDVEEIDAYTFRGQLNALERKVVAELLDELGARADDRIVCDGATMFGPLRERFAGLEARDRAESIHVSVAAASILAKHERDVQFAGIAARYEADFGPISGGGYLNAATRRFLDAYRAAHGGLPPEARRSWGAGKPGVA
jgi:ribonuclease HII